MTTKPIPFTLRVPDADIADLTDRLARARFPDQAPGDAWAYVPMSLIFATSPNIGAASSTGGSRKPR